jgi:S1-C subfamily serine protease
MNVHLRPTLVGLGIALLATGCGVQAAAPPAQEPAVKAPDLTQVSSDVPNAVRVRFPVLARDSAERRARSLTVRVRNRSCEGVGVGSGFALTPHVLITNRHVLAGADALEVATWEGRSHSVSYAEVGVLGDLGVVQVAGRLPTTGRYGRPPRAGDSVTAVGYPLGGELTLSQGTVVDRVDGRDFGVPGEVLRISAHVRPGNSGGPLLDRRGRIVGIVYAREIATGLGLVIPVDTIKRLIAIAGFEDVPPCGSE